MSFDDLLKYSFLKTIREKKNIYFVSILVICVILLITVLNYVNAFESSINESLINDPNERKILVTPNSEVLIDHWNDFNYDFGFEKISELEHVTDVYLLSYEQSSGISTFKDEEHSGVISLLYGSKYTVPEIVAGEMFDKDATGVAICPEIFYPSNDIEDARKSKNPFYTKNEILGKKFTLDVKKRKYEDGVKNDGIYSQEFEIIGLYKSSEYSFYCYISPNDIKNIWSMSIANMNNPNEVRDLSYVVVIDKLENRNEVMKEISDMDFNVDYISELDYVYVNKIKRTCLVIFSLVVLAIMLLTVFYAKKKIHNNSYEMGVLKVIGYSDFDVVKFSSMQVFYMALFSSLIGTVAYKFLLMFFKYHFKNFLIVEKAYFYFVDVVEMSLIAILIIVFIPIIANTIITKFHLNNQLISLMKNDKE